MSSSSYYIPLTEWEMQLKLEGEIEREKRGERYYDRSNYPDPWGEIVREMNPIFEEYRKQVKDSDGFDVTIDMSFICNWRWSMPAGLAFIFPLRGKENEPEIINMSQLAMDKYNVDKAQDYRFVKILKVNAKPVSGILYYITFVAKDNGKKEETFQARVWKGPGKDGERDVDFCRMKKTSSSTHQGDEMSPDSDVDNKRAPTYKPS